MIVEISLGDTFSLKDKRQIVKSIIERLKNRYNISIAEVDRQDDIRRTVIGMACVSTTSEHVNRQLDHVLSFMEKDGRFTVENVEKEML
ncbi:DUF503 family protein [Biomaibacter acetigenes]|uniref:DUF503 family protein n=2 Tax=Biomaibacter acetigenes TaxID=2316383 RepID=A0A3G2RA85_9FIRM|nr:DUF503 family protein [Biomaibacter acetigenes]RKL63821.1 DUF503 domain-containing protein [Thermoanaerobacteraceae bacterium SP2]